MKNNATTLLGIALTFLGVGIFFTAFWINSVRYMAAEDLGLDTSNPELFSQLVTPSVFDKAILFTGGILLLLGGTVLVMSGVQARKTKRRQFQA